MRPPFRSVLIAASALLTAGILPAVALQTPKPFDPVAPGRDTEPVVLTGASFPGWSAPDEVTAKAPSADGLQCYSAQNNVGGDASKCTHNQYEQPDVATGAALGQGVPVNR